MGRDTDLLRRLRSKGLHVVEIAGWQTRGSDNYAPRIAVNHHTAGPLRGNAPSLGTCINGRGGVAPVPGPLANVHKARDQTVSLIAAGKSNNAGIGSWRGITGNMHTWGVENENTGLGNEPWSEADIDTMARICAAFIDGTSSVDFVCQHFEWAPTRKIDALHIDPALFRQRVARYLGPVPRPTPVPAPPPDPENEVTAAEMKALLAASEAQTRAWLDGKIDDINERINRIDRNVNQTNTSLGDLKAGEWDVATKSDADVAEIKALLSAVKDSAGK